MARSTNSRLWPDDGPVVVSAPSLQTAHRRIRDRYGEDAVILSTRTVARRHELGLGQERLVEVVVQPPGGKTSGRSPFSAGPGATAAPAAAPSALPADLLREVERIEALVEQVSTGVGSHAGDDAWPGRDPVGGPLVAAGTSPTVARRLLARFAAAQGRPATDPADLRRWLATQLRASNCDWDGFYGCHAFLGDSGVGRSDLVLASALRLQGLGRRTLVLGVLPGDPGYVHRLQEAAAAGGFDAAVVTAASHLTAAEPHFAGYDAVLAELPRLDDPALALGGPLHAWLAPNVSFHRHLVLAADRDPAEQADLVAVTRDWNCDWVAFTRLDRTRRPGKLLDVLEAVPLAVSLLGRDPLHGGEVAVASSAAVADLAAPAPVPAAAGRLDREVRA